MPIIPETHAGILAFLGGMLGILTGWLTLLARVNSHIEKKANAVVRVHDEDKEAHEKAFRHQLVIGDESVEVVLARIDEKLKRLDNIPCLNPENHRDCQVFPRFGA